jgi:hypothetical protein
MLMTFAAGDECLAAVYLVDSLDQAQLLEFLQRPVDGNQSHSGAGLACPVENFHWRKGMGRGSHSLNHGSACVSQSITIFLQTVKAEFSIHHLPDNENLFQ